MKTYLKKSLTLVVLLSSLVYAVPDTAVNFTVIDMNGNSHTLFNYLDSGKYVLLDFSRNSAM